MKLFNRAQKCRWPIVANRKLFETPKSLYTPNLHLNIHNIYAKCIIVCLCEVNLKQPPAQKSRF